ncbi:SDR family oxidoreductase [Corynebacterium sanguinis]
MTHLALAGRTALVTGVSRRRGIGFAIARRLADMGASLVIHHHSAHDAAQPWGRDDIDAVVGELAGHLQAQASLAHLAADLSEPQAPAELVRKATEVTGPLDILVCNHARSGSDSTLMDTAPELIDAHWATNTRSVLLATQAFAKQHDSQRPGGRVIWMTSGQQLGPLPGEVAYAASKAALAGVTQTVADELIEHGIVLNTVNPGPVNSGYLDPGVIFSDADLESAKAHFPGKQFGEPDDPARLVAWLASDEGRWVVGQVLNTEGGFRRYG